MKRFLFVFLAVGAIIALPAAASAQSPEPPKPFAASVSYLVDRPDSGNHGDWALDKVTRTVYLFRVSEFKACPDVDPASVKITAATKAEDSNVCANYRGVIDDEGTFETIPGAKSPNAGVKIDGTVKGKLAGGLLTKEFFGHYHGDAWASDKTFKGTAGGPTSQWVAKYFDLAPTSGYGVEEWGWDYTATCEHWSDHSDTNGAAPKDGDIVGKVCPSPTPTPSATPTPRPSATPTPTTDKPGLPKTGVHAG